MATRKCLGTVGLEHFTMAATMELELREHARRQCTRIFDETILICAERPYRASGAKNTMWLYQWHSLPFASRPSKADIGACAANSTCVRKAAVSALRKQCLLPQLEVANKITLQ